MRRRAPTALLALLALMLVAACDGGMQEQARIDPYAPPPDRWPGLAGALPPVPGTVSRSAPEMPEEMRVSAALVARGGERFAIHCSPCHGPIGLGNGGAVGRMIPQPPSLLDAEHRAMTDAHLFQVITAGVGRMGGYADRIAPDDRIAIIAWLRDRQATEPVLGPVAPPDSVIIGTTPPGGG